VIGRHALRGDGPIRIARDRHGVPHVQASGDADLYRGLGYCHGVDRALQMLLVRILAQGRASLVLGGGEETLRLDRFFRRLDFGADAAEEAAKVPAATRTLVEAYCDGVNAALARRVPWELRVLGHAPGPWTPRDSVLVSRVSGYVALAQSQADMERLLVEMVQGGVPRGHLEALFPGLLNDLDETLLRRVRLGERLVPDRVGWARIVPPALASNNWAIAGRRTASGSPLLANDPHLEGNRLPAVWYEVVLERGPRFCCCATMPGLPGPLLGRTNTLAWGATYAFMDAVDSWIEDCRDGCFRRVTVEGETWVPFRVRTEVIERRRQAPVTVVFHENDHGVLDGDPSEPGLYLATRWSAGAGAGAASLAAMLGMLDADDVEAGMALLGRIETAWNWVLADRHGNIGYQMSGRLPARAEGRTGLLPLPGWDPRNDWRGFAPPSDLPRVLNPPAGFVVTANDDLSHLGRTRPINLPMGAYRAERIATLLAARTDWDVAGAARMQMDVHSLQAARFLDVLRPLLPPTPEGDLLRRWDCGYGVDSTGATLFERFYRALLREVFGAVCGTAVMEHLLDDTAILADYYANFDTVLLQERSVWYGDEGRDAVFARVAARALAVPVPRWGERQRLRMRHLLLGGRLPAWLGFDHGPVEIPGGRATIHQGQLYRAGGRETTFVPSFRMVTDLAEEAVHTCLAGGPSDRRFSRWYTAGVADWLAGRFKTLRPAGPVSPRT
jgi:penicillin amidase